MWVTSRTGCVGWDLRKVSQWYLSPYVEKPFNWKVIKSFVPQLRSRQRFLCFGIPMFYVYMLWTFYVRFTYSCMNMSISRIRIWLCNKGTPSLPLFPGLLSPGVPFVRPIWHVFYCPSRLGWYNVEWPSTSSTLYSIWKKNPLFIGAIK